MESLTDRFARKLNYVRISLTDRCNYRCTYCMPPQGVPFLDHQRILRYEEILFLCRVLFRMGVRRVRFTGGEPLVRRGLLPFLEQLRGELPELRLALTTNASLLAPHVPRLAALGLDSLNVSLDTLDPGRFRELTRLGNLEDVLGGLDAAREAGIRPIKLNAVLVRGQNDQELPRLLDFAHERGFLLRLRGFHHWLRRRSFCRRGFHRDWLGGRRLRCRSLGWLGLRSGRFALFHRLRGSRLLFRRGFLGFLRNSGDEDAGDREGNGC